MTETAQPTSILSLRSTEFEELLGRIAEGASERERNRVLPFEQIIWIKDAGLGRLRIPKDEGGAGITLPELFQFLMDLAAADSNVAHILRVHYGVVEHFLHSTDTQRRAASLAIINDNKIFGGAFSEQNDKPAGGFGGQLPTSDVTLRKNSEGDDYLLNGTKYYSTGTIFSDHATIMAVGPDGYVVLATVPTDREGLTLTDDWDGFGQRLTGSGSTIAENVHVGEDEFVDLQSRTGESVPTYQGSFLQLYLQAVTAGVLAAAAKDAAALVRGRARNFGHASHPVPAHDWQILQVVGEIAADAYAAEAIVLHAAEALQASADSVIDGRPSVDVTRDATFAAAKAKVAVDRFAAATATRLFDAGGASSTQSSRNLDRHWRNVRTISTHNPAALKATAIGDWVVNGETTMLSNGPF